MFGWGDIFWVDLIYMQVYIADLYAGLYQIKPSASPLSKKNT